MHKSNVYKKHAQITDLQSQTAGEARIFWKVLTLPTHGGSQRAQNFTEWYGAPWEHTHPHSNMNAQSRKTNSLLNIAPGVSCIFNTNLFNIILALVPYVSGGDSHTHLSLFISDTHAQTHTHPHQYTLIRCSAECTNTCASQHTVCNIHLSILFSLSVNSQQESVPRMVSLPGTRPQAVSKKCQLSLNAVTYLTEI